MLSPGAGWLAYRQKRNGMSRAALGRVDLLNDVYNTSSKLKAQESQAESETAQNAYKAVPDPAQRETAQGETTKTANKVLTKDELDTIREEVKAKQSKLDDHKPYQKKKNGRAVKAQVNLRILHPSHHCNSCE